MTRTLCELAPLLAVPDVQRSAEYYRRLGFEILFAAKMEGLPGYGIVMRDGFTIHLMEDKSVDPAETTNGFVATVADVDALFAEFSAAGAFDKNFPRHLDAIREHPPEDKEYGRRDFIFVTPDGQIVIFGQDLEQ